MNEAAAKSIIRKSVTKTKLGVALTGLLSGAMGAYLVGNIFAKWEPMSTALLILSGLVGTVFMAVGLLCLYVALRPDPLLRLIFNEPNRIAWVYTENIRLYSRETQNVNLYIYSTDKKRHFLMSTRKNVDSLLEVLKARAPHARFGYDKDFEKTFRN